jgi:hypothetical protein
MFLTSNDSHIPPIPFIDLLGLRLARRNWLMCWMLMMFARAHSFGHQIGHLFVA